MKYATLAIATLLFLGCSKQQLPQPKTFPLIGKWAGVDTISMTNTHIKYAEIDSFEYLASSEYIYYVVNNELYNIYIYSLSANLDTLTLLRQDDPYRNKLVYTRLSQR